MNLITQREKEIEEVEKEIAKIYKRHPEAHFRISSPWNRKIENLEEKLQTLKKILAEETEFGNILITDLWDLQASEVYNTEFVRGVQEAKKQIIDNLSIKGDK